VKRLVTEIGPGKSAGDRGSPTGNSGGHADAGTIRPHERQAPKPEPNYEVLFLDSRHSCLNFRNSA
jgi:hypothetical protein